MKRILILGANGFIGKNCVDFYSKNPDYQVTAAIFSRRKYTKVKNVTYVHADLRREDHVQKLLRDQDIVIQAAATTTGSKDVIEKPYIHVTDNAVMNSWIFREAVLNNIEHVVFFSCTVMYQSSDTPQSETDWSAADRIYKNYFGVGSTKVYLENMCDFYSSLGKTKFTAIRHSNVFGPYDKFDLDKCHVVPAFINKIVNSDRVLEVWGDGSAKRDIVFIDDLVNFVDLVIQKQESKYELLNCGCGRAYSIRELAEMIMKANEKSLELKFDASKPNIPTTVVLNCEKAKNMLGWSPKTDLIDAFRKTINWYKANHKQKTPNRDR
jgi:nucleoside-diphosphate-sugar epimerase